MWKNPFQIGHKWQEGKTQECSFEAAQGALNFVLLHPTVLPEDCQVTALSLRSESMKVRGSFRFVVQGKKRAFRVKQFFYDWSYPVVLADTNLIAQGTAFVAQGVVGFRGEDYKGHVAACYSRWFTQVEVSVFEGAFAEEELQAFFEGLKPVREEAVEKIGVLPFAETSHTARFHQPRWGMDEVIRVTWQKADDFDEGQVEEGLLLPPREYGEFAAESIGFLQHPEGEEYQAILRSTRNQTDVIWVWIAPERLSEAVPPKYGARQRWQVEEVAVTTRDGQVVQGWIGEQDSPHGGWRMHWKHEGKSYHVYVRPSLHFEKADLLAFVGQFQA